MEALFAPCWLLAWARPSRPASLCPESELSWVEAVNGSCPCGEGLAALAAGLALRRGGVFLTEAGPAGGADLIPRGMKNLKYQFVRFF